MIYFYSSKIASITKYNKYTSNDDYIKIFTDYLYKHKEELLEFDTNNTNLVLLNDEEHMDTIVLKNFNQNTKNDIKNIINSEVTNNDDLIEKTKQLNSLVNSTEIDEKEKNCINKQLNSKVNCSYGTNSENNAITLYEKTTNLKIYNNNAKLFSYKYENFAICGKTDGFVDIGDKTYIFETKNRKNRIFSLIPIYEKIQLLCYTVICNNKNIVFTQCINDKIDITILDNYSDDTIWNDVLQKLEIYADLLYKMQNNTKLRHSFINLSNVDEKFKLLKKYLNWL